MKVLKDKKGSALLFAIVFMVICFLFTMLVVVVNFRLKKATEASESIYDMDINEKFVFDEMGEAFFRAVEEHKTDDEIKNAVIAASGCENPADFPYDIQLLYFSNLESINEKFDVGDNENLLEQIQEKLNYEKQATSTFGKIVQNTINGVKNTVNKIQTGFNSILAIIKGDELPKEPTLDDLLEEYSNSMGDLKSLYEIKLLHKNTDNMALDVAIGVEYSGGNLPTAQGSGNTAHAELSEKYTVINWSDRAVENVPEDFKELEKVFESKNDTKIEGKATGIDYDNILIVRVVNGIIDLFRR